jgi:hypothetical protein
MTANLLTFTKEDLVFLATKEPSLKIRQSAAEALYRMGFLDGARDMRETMSAALAAPSSTVIHADEDAGCEGVS